MGCGSSINARQKQAGKHKPYIVVIEHPKSGTPRKFQHFAAEDSLALTKLMNVLSFDKNQCQEIDANFISTYSKELKRFQYYVQRLIGIEIENEKNPNEGSIWRPYINEQAENWDEICENEAMVHRDDEIVWKYEKIGS